MTWTMKEPVLECRTGVRCMRQASRPCTTHFVHPYGPLVVVKVIVGVEAQGQAGRRAQSPLLAVGAVVRSPDLSLRK